MRRRRARSEVRAAGQRRGHHDPAEAGQAKEVPAIVKARVVHVRTPASLLSDPVAPCIDCRSAAVIPAAMPEIGNRRPPATVSTRAHDTFVRTNGACGASVSEPTRQERFETTVLVHSTPPTTWRAGCCATTAAPRTSCRTRACVPFASSTPCTAHRRRRGSSPSCATPASTGSARSKRRGIEESFDEVEHGSAMLDAAGSARIAGDACRPGRRRAAPARLHRCPALRVPRGADPARDGGDVVPGDQRGRRRADGHGHVAALPRSRAAGAPGAGFAGLRKSS